MNKAVVIVAGGSGKRMNSDIPKQFLELNGKEIVLNTIEVFKKFDPKVKLVLVLPKSELDSWTHQFSGLSICQGGETRFHSVKNGIALCENAELIGVHDGVRPAVSTDTIKRCFEAAQEFGSGVPVLPISQSIRMLEGEENTSVDRSKFVSVQTPQCFNAELLRKAFEQDYQESFTDDATVYEACGYKVKLVEGNPENIKITRPVDLQLVRYLMKNE